MNHTKFKDSSAFATQPPLLSPFGLCIPNLIVP